MIEFAKEILYKVSFDKNLFQRELSKFLRLLKASEKNELREWTYEKYGKKFPDLIKTQFNNPENKNAA